MQAEEKGRKPTVAVFLDAVPAPRSGATGTGSNGGGVAAWRISRLQRERLAAAVPHVDFRFCDDEPAFLAALPDAEAVLVWAFRPEWTALAPRLRWIATPAAGRDYFKCPKAGIEMTYGSFHGRIIGETVAGMLLAVRRGLLPAQVAQAAGDPWPRETIAPAMRTLRGSHAVIIGFGSIGTWIASCLKPFHVRITGIRRHPDASPRPAFFDASDRILPLSELDTVLPSADSVILSLPGTPETDNLLGARRLSLLPAHAVLCNIGRGNAIDEAALVASLRTGHLSAACLDVFRTEPLPAGSPLRSCPRLYLFPHSSAIAPEYLDLYLDEYIPLVLSRFP